MSIPIGDVEVKQFQSPVLTLDTFEDYVYDVRWHPSHPGVFASTDGEGWGDPGGPETS